MEDPRAAFKDIGIAVALIAASILLITRVSKEADIWKAVGIVAAITAFLLIATVIMDKIDTQGSTGFTVYKSGNKGYFGLAAGIVALLLSFRILKNYTENEIWSYFGIIAAMAALMTAMIDLSKIGGKSSIGQGVAFFLAASALLKMVKVIDKIDSLDLERKKKTTDILIGIVLGLAVIMRSLKSVKFGGGASIIMAVIAIKMMIGALNSISKLDTSALRSNSGILVGIGAFMALLVILNAALNKKNTISLSNSSKNVIKMKDSFIGIGIAFLLISLSMKMLSKVDFSNWVGMLLTGILFLALVGEVMLMAAKAGPNAKKAGRAVLTTAIALSLLTLVTAAMAYIEWDTLVKGIVFFGSLGLVFAAIIKAASHYEKGVKSLGGIMACLIILDLIVVAMGYLQLSGVKFDNIFAGMFALMGGFALVIAAADKFKTSNLGSLIAIIAVMGAVIAGITIVLNYFNGALGYEWSSILAFFGGMALLIAAMGFSAMLMKSYDKTFKESLGLLSVIGAFSASFFAITLALGLFSSKIDPEGALVAFAVSALLIAEIGALAAGLSLFESDIKKSLGILANIGILTGSVFAIMLGLSLFSSKIDPDKCIALAKSAGGLLVAVGVVAGIATIIGNFAVAAAVGAAIIAGFILLIAGVIALIGALFPAETIQKAVTICSLLGEAIGGFIGGVISQIEAARNRNLPELGTNLSSFAENVQGFGLIAELPEGLTEKAKDLKKAVAQINDIGNDGGIFKGIKEKLRGLFSKDDAEEAVSDKNGNLASVETYITSFVRIANSLSEIDDDSYNRIPTISELIGKLTTALSGKSIHTDVERLGEQMTAYSQALVTFSSHMTLIPDNILAKTGLAAGVLERMAAASNSIPNGSREGGKGNLLSWVMGDNDLDTFGTRMSEYAVALRSFSDGVIDLPDELEDKTDLAAKVLERMAQASYDIPNGRWNDKFNLLSFLFGDNDIDYFGYRMVELRKISEKFL